MKDRDLIKLLKKNGWQLDRINGSHHIFRKEGITLSVPVHGKDVPTGLLQQILKDAGLKQFCLLKQKARRFCYVIRISCHLSPGR